MTRSAGRGARLALLAAWFAVALTFASRHVMWRDEVRALSFAIQGDDTIDMLRLLHGEGHPALWYLLLRAGHAASGSVLALAVLAFLIGAGAATIIALRAPFGWPLLALALAGRFLLYDYVAMARNYGLSALILFALAALYPRWRAHGIGIGALLALLCNANVHSVVLAAAFWTFWAIDLWRDDTIERRRAAGLLLLNGALVVAGAAACVAEVWPAHNDIAQLAPPPGGMPAYLALLPLHLGDAFSGLGGNLLRAATPPVLTLLLLGSLLTLARSPAALIGAVLALAGMLVLFGLVYPGEYRHQALYLAFLLTMMWLARRGFGGRWRVPHVATRIGTACLIMLLLAQVWLSVARLRDLAVGVPESRARDLGALLRRPALADAIVIGDPDFLLEPLPYYAPNPIYLARERRFGRIFTLTRAARRAIGFGDLLATARMLHARTGRAIVIVLRTRLDAPLEPAIVARGSYGPLVIVPAEVAAFRAATRRIARFGPATSGESYDVYTLTG